LAVGGEEPVVIECWTQDPEAAVEIQKVVFRVLTFTDAQARELLKSCCDAPGAGDDTEMEWSG